MIQPLLRGQTVTLRPLAVADAGALAAAAAESRGRYVYTRVPDGVEDAQRYIETALAEREVGRRQPFAIVWQDRVAGRRVALRTDERNAQSRRAIERLGAIFEGVRRADMPGQDGSVRNSAYYSILQVEWPDVRKRLDDALPG